MRRSDWQARLGVLIEERKVAPFEWGSNDCCLWVADAVLAMTGIDPAHDIRGAYKTARGAASALRMHGGLAGAGERCGTPIPPLCAAAGDVGIVNDGESDLLAVCNGDVWLAVAKNGLGMMSLSAARKAWRVA